MIGTKFRTSKQPSRLLFKTPAGFLPACIESSLASRSFGAEHLCLRRSPASGMWPRLWFRKQEIRAVKS